MLDKAVICEQVLGTPISEVVPFIQDPGIAGQQGANKWNEYEWWKVLSKRGMNVSNVFYKSEGIL